MDGLLIIDKPEGLTSHDVVARARRILGERRIGHTGTLDPFATGVLVLLLGRATRLAQFLSGADKEYLAVIRLGYATDTGDSTGRRLEAAGVIEDRARVWSEEEIEGALAALRGEIEQIPPMYSAKKIRGVKLYEMARRGEVVERKAVRIHVYELEAVPFNGGWLRHNSDGTSDLRVRVTCSSGTYIRALAESIGERLGVGAHLTALRRTRAGHFRIEDATSLDRLEEAQRSATLADIMVSINAALSGMPFLHLTAEEARRARNGVAVRVNRAPGEDWPDGAQVAIKEESGRLIAVGVFDAARRSLRPRVVLSPDIISPEK